MARNTKRVSVPLSIKGAGKLEDLAQEGGVTQAEIMRRALASYEYLKHAENAGGEVQVQRPDGVVNNVILP